MLAVGDVVQLEIGAVAHGGLCVARADNRVVFVRYALPGERASVRITEAKRGSFCRGEAIEILRADSRRVTAPCAHFGPGGCGGCDWQHASADLQRELKASVVAEQLQRMAGIDISVVVEPLPSGDSEGFGWRTRVRWGIDRSSGSAEYDAVLGPRRYRSHDVVPISTAKPCLIAADGLSEAAESRVPPLRSDEVVLVRRAEQRPAAVFLSRNRVVRSASGTDAESGEVREFANGRSFRVATAGFWQAHEHAAEVLAGAVAKALDGVKLQGGSAWDLYGGVGLFTTVLAEHVGERGAVISVESDRAASRLANRNLADLPQARAVAARVDHFLTSAAEAVDAVVLDPPRSGAGKVVTRAIAARHPQIVIYVACDPSALARDAATFGEAGYELTALRAFDAFPQTQHVECVAVFRSVS
ncbi:MAG: TRAM domain-containing protein [Nakamurella sp.]